MNCIRPGLLGVVAISLQALLISPAGAQIDRQPMGLSPQAGSSNYRYAEPNELTIVVSVIGAVRVPGRYEISLNVNLLDVIALAGGWTENADWSDVTLTRQVQGSSGVERKELYYDFDDLTKINDSQLKLHQGDIIVVPTSASITFEDVLRYATALGVIITTVIAVGNN
jgi:hypothetical protein